MATGSLIEIFTNGAHLANGLPAAGGKVYSFVAGTAVPQALYKASDLITAHTNPMILDSSGKAPGGGGAYMLANGYKIRLDDATDVTLWTQDNWLDVGQTQVSLVQANLVKSQIFNLDNGAGTIIDGVVMKLSRAVTLSVARIVYLGATTGTVAAGSIQVGTTQGGSDLVAVQNYLNGKSVGSETSLTLASAAVAAGQAIHVRHVGVAATQAGEAQLELEYA